MSDTQVNQFDAKGTTAERMGFTPNPPTPASGPDNGYVFYDTDDGTLYCWDGSAWQPCIIGGAGTVTNTGTLTSGKTIIGNGGVDVTVSSLTANLVASSSGTFAGAVAGANSRLVGSGSGGSGSAYTELTVGAGLTMGASSLATSTAQHTRAITFAIDGGGSAITTSFKADLYIPYACTITAVTLLADQSGSVQLDIQKCAFASFPASLASIVASDPPVLSSAQTSQDTTLTSWTTAISAGDCLEWSVTSVSTITRLNAVLTVTVN